MKDDLPSATRVLSFWRANIDTASIADRMGVEESAVSLVLRQALDRQREFRQRLKAGDAARKQARLILRSVKGAA